MTAIGMAPAAALSHAFLSEATPLVGGSTGIATRVRLSLVALRFSGIDVTTGDGQAVPTKPAVVDPGNDRQLVLPLPPLAPGRYRVRWHVVSVDTHRTEGEYSFTVEP